MLLIKHLMDPFIQNVQIEEVINSDYIEDILNDPYFYDDEYDDSSIGSFLDAANDF